MPTPAPIAIASLSSTACDALLEDTADAVDEAGTRLPLSAVVNILIVGSGALAVEGADVIGGKPSTAPGV